MTIRKVMFSFWKRMASGIPAADVMIAAARKSRISAFSPMVRPFRRPRTRSCDVAEEIEIVSPATTARIVEKATALIRSEEHTSELQSLMRISYAVFCLKKKKNRYKRHE